MVERIPSLPINAIAVHDKTVDAKSATTLKEIFEKYEPYTGEAGSKSDEVVLILSTSGTTGRPKACSSRTTRCSSPNVHSSTA